MPCLRSRLKLRSFSETGLPTRWYVPKVDVRMDLLVPTDQTSHCPYKGQAEYFSARTGEATKPRTSVRSHPHAAARERRRYAGYVAFYDEHVDTFVDGVHQERPKTKFS